MATTCVSLSTLVWFQPPFYYPPFVYLQLLGNESSSPGGGRMKNSVPPQAADADYIWNTCSLLDAPTLERIGTTNAEI